LIFSFKFSSIFLFSVTKTGNDTFKIEIFDSGKGRKYHAEKFSSKKQKFLSYIEYNDIPEEKILQMGFIKELIEPRNLSTTNGNNPSPFSSKDLYEGIMARFYSFLNQRHSKDCDNRLP